MNTKTATKLSPLLMFNCRPALCELVFLKLAKRFLQTGSAPSGSQNLIPIHDNQRKSSLLEHGFDLVGPLSGAVCKMHMRSAT